MTLKELKNAITVGSTFEDFMVFLCPDNHFLALQYAETISRNRPCNINRVNSIYDAFDPNMALVIAPDENLNLLITDTFDEQADNYGKFSSTIVICDKIDKKIKSALSQYVIEFPKLENWCVEEYAHSLCPAIKLQSIRQLCEACDYDIYHIKNEIDKLTLFSLEQQQSVLDIMLSMKNAGYYSVSFYTFINYLVCRVRQPILEYFRNAKAVDLGTVGIVRQLVNELKKIYLVYFGTANDQRAAGIESKVVYAIKNMPKPVGVSYSGLSRDLLQKLIKTAAEIDNQITSGKLDIPDNRKMDYIICKLFAC